jgi:MFS family permease
VFIAYKLNPLIFYLIIALSAFVCPFLFCLPQLNSNQIFCLVDQALLAIFAGPLIPSGFMIAREILKSINSYLISFFSIGLIMGAIVSQHVAASLLDNLQLPADWLNFTDATSAYVIPFLTMFSCSMSIMFYLIALIVNRKYRRYLDTHVVQIA